MEYLLFFAIGLLVYTATLWFAAKLVGDEGKFLEFLIISTIASVVGLIPGVGGILSIVVFFVLLNRLMDIDLLKGIVICALAFFIRFGVFIGLEKLLSQ